MESRNNSVRAQFSQASRVLFTWSGNIRHRLWGAYLKFHTLKTEDLPEELQGDFNWIMARFSENGHVTACLDGMSESGAVEVAKRIVYLEYRLRKSVRPSILSFMS